MFIGGAERQYSAGWTAVPMRNIGGVERAWDSVPMCLFGDLVLKNGQYVIGELLFDFILSRGKVMTYDCFLYRRSGILRIVSLCLTIFVACRDRSI